MNNEMLNNIELRKKHTYKLEQLIKENTNYSKIIEESKTIDNLIISEIIEKTNP